MNRYFYRRRKLFLGTGFMLVFLTSFFYCYLKTSIPDRICIGSEQTGILNFSVPFPATLQVNTEDVVLTSVSGSPAEQIDVSLDEPFSIYAQNQGSYKLRMKLFGIWNYKDIQIQVLGETEVIPGGSAIGIYLESDGILVIGTSAITDEKGELNNPCGEVLQSGDYIIAINGNGIAEKEELIEQIKESRGNPMTLTVRRKQKQIDLEVVPVSVGNGQYRLGIWVRDDTQGIGTLTYMTKDGAFGALGHGISDSDVGEIVEIQGGSLYPSDIYDILKGSIGKPGSLSGTICYGEGECLGTIQGNTQYGIFGQIDLAKMREMEKHMMPVAYRQEVKTGSATIRCSIDRTVREYSIEITHINQGFYSKNKDMVIQVTDPRLLEQTGGIVQGMSGSPILQNGKIVGAVTHVFVNDPTKGYGIFIENMLDAAE